MIALNDDWLSWPPESLESFFLHADWPDAIGWPSISTTFEAETESQDIHNETGP